MNILSKSAPAEESITAMQAILKDLGCGITFSQEKHPLQNCYSVNLASTEAPSHIYSNGKGTQSVEVDTIDNLVKEKVDFIKLDIEGAVQDAIEGARETIKNYKPILAICVYHKAEDWYKIPEKVLEIQSNYDVYLRHYMEGIFETVMYFIPKT